MSRFGYSAKIDGPCARAFGKEIRASPKHAVEICRAIRGMRLKAAEEFLDAVQAKRKAVPFLTHRKKLAHRKGAKGSGRYPTKAAKEIMKVLKNAESNAVYKGFDAEKLRIVHASAYKGMIIPGILPRAFGRATAFNKPLTNVEIVLKEMS